MNPAPNDQSWLATLWDAVSSAGVTNIMTFAGVLAALGIALWSSRERRKERRAEELAEARLVRVRSTEIQSHARANGVRALYFAWGITNKSGSALLDVRCQVWSDAHSLTAEKRMPIVDEFNDRGGPSQPIVQLPDATEPHTWRVIWLDRHGNEWVVDRLNQVAPRPFKEGEHPRPLAP